MTLPPVNYAKFAHYFNRHHARFKKHVEAYGVTCQACKGDGGYTESILDDGTGPWHQCGYCEGTGKMTRRMRGVWLTDQRQAKQKIAP